VANFIELVYTRMGVTAFTRMFGQISPILPYIFTAPFYFLGKIELGIMTQTADAFGKVSDSMTIVVNYYTELANFKSVVERLNSFARAMDEAQTLAASGPVLGPAETPQVALEGVHIALPNGRRIVEASDLALAAGENVLVTGPSGSGK